MSTDLIDEGLAERLRRMAREDTAGAVPWPAFTTVVRSSRRRRAITAAAAVSTVWLAAAGVVAVTQDDGGGTAQPARTPVPTGSAVPTPEPSNSLGAYVDRRRPGAEVPAAPVGIPDTGGALADDTDLLSGLREEVARRQFADGPEQVHVLWAGTLDGRRHAVTLAPTPDAMGTGSMEWRLQAWYLDGQLRQGDEQQTLDPGTDLRTVTTSFLLTAAPDRMPVDGAARIVLAPAARQVDVGSLPSYSADARKQRTFVPLRHEGPAWVGHETPDQLRAAFLRLTAEDGRRTLITGTSYVTGQDTEPELAPVAAPGSDATLLGCGIPRDYLERGIEEAQPVYAATRGSAPRIAPGVTPSPGQPVAASAFGVLRLGDAYLVSGCVDAVGEQGHATVTTRIPPGGARDLSAMLLMDAGSRRRWAVVVAPEGAATVEVAGVSAQLRNRFATVELPAGAPPDRDLRATIRRADGSVLRVQPPSTPDRELDGAYLDEIPRGY